MSDGMALCDVSKQFRQDSFELAKLVEDRECRERYADQNDMHAQLTDTEIKRRSKPTQPPTAKNRPSTNDNPPPNTPDILMKNFLNALGKSTIAELHLRKSEHKNEAAKSRQEGSVLRPKMVTFSQRIKFSHAMENTLRADFGKSLLRSGVTGLIAIGASLFAWKGGVLPVKRKGKFHFSL